jgi:cell division protein FtsB
LARTAKAGSSTKPPARRTAAPKVPTSAKTARTPKPPDPARRRAVVRGALLSVLLVGILFAFVYPTQTFLDQRSRTNDARSQLDLLRTENAKLADASSKLHDDDEIARIARQLYGLVKPGETPYVILPAPTTTTVAPAPAVTAPAGGTGKSNP